MSLWCIYNLIELASSSRYNKLSRNIREIAEKISALDPKEPFRTESSAQLLEKLYVLGLIPTKWDLNNVAKVSASSFCRRRLPVVMVRSEYFFSNIFVPTNIHEIIQFLDKMSENIKNATNLIEQGHIRVGAEMIKDPAFLVSRTLEDFVTWVDSSAIRKHVLEYNNIVS